MKLNQAFEDHVADALYDVFSNGSLKIFGDSLIVSISLPTPAFEPAKNGVKLKNGTWEDVATGSGIASSCTFESSDGKVLEGTVTESGGGGDLELVNTNIKIGQMVTVTDGKGTIE